MTGSVEVVINIYIHYNDEQVKLINNIFIIINDQHGRMESKHSEGSWFSWEA